MYICPPGNILYFAKKEQCLTLNSQLGRVCKPSIKDCRIFRGCYEEEYILIYPNDGYPSEITAERIPHGILLGVCSLIENPLLEGQLVTT